MLRGRVTRNGEPVVPIDLVLRKRSTKLPAVIDTGFNGYLCVPNHLLRQSDWQAIGTEKYELATGAIVEQEIYLGEILMAGRRQSVYTVATDADDILIGTKLLLKSVLIVDFPLKRVTVR